MSKSAVMKIIRVEPKFEFDPDRYILAMWLIYRSRPSTAEPDETGAYYVGDCGNVPEKNWTRLTPYSPAEPR
jgi:hypothetical protein